MVKIYSGEGQPLTISEIINQRYLGEYPVTKLVSFLKSWAKQVKERYIIDYLEFTGGIRQFGSDVHIPNFYTYYKESERKRTYVFVDGDKILVSFNVEDDKPVEYVKEDDAKPVDEMVVSFKIKAENLYIKFKRNLSELNRNLEFEE